MAKFIPEQHFKGIQSPDSKCPLAFITPYGTGKAAEKRIETVKSWSRGWQNKDKDESKYFEIIDNKAMTGFKISNEVRRWSTSNVVWRIEDPRGFQLEISSGNMAYIMANCVIDHGEFKSEMIWVRDGKENYLLPVGSKEHAEYTKNTAALNANLKIKDLTIGDHIHALDGTDGIFLGGFYILKYDTYDRNQKFLKTQRRYFIKESDGGGIAAKSGFKGLSIIKKGAEENKDYTDLLNSKASSRYNSFICASKKNFKPDEIIQTAKYIVLDKPKDPKFYYAQIQDGSVYQVYRSHYGNRGASYCLTTIDRDENTIETVNSINYGGSRHAFNMFGVGNNIPTGERISKLMKEYNEPVKLVVTINDKEYTVFE